MICTQFLKITKKEIHYYMPDLKDYLFTEQYRKERGRFGFEVPADVTCKQAIPSFPKDNKIFKKLSKKSQIIVQSLFHLFVSGVDRGYPEVICVEIEEGKYLKFLFQYYFTYDYMNIPFVHYEPVDVVSKKEASKFLICIDQD